MFLALVSYLVSRHSKYENDPFGAFKEVVAKLRMKIAGDDVIASWPARWNICFADWKEVLLEWRVTFTGGDAQDLTGLEFLGHKPVWSTEYSCWVPVPVDFNKTLASIIQPGIKSEWDMKALRITAQMKRYCFVPNVYEYLKRKADALVQRFRSSEGASVLWQAVEGDLRHPREYYCKRYSPYEMASLA